MHTPAGHLPPGWVAETPGEHPACSRVHRASQQQAVSSQVQALSCPMEVEQISPGELFWLDPCYRKMDQHLLLIQTTKKLPMADWGGQPLHQDCPSFSMQQPLGTGWDFGHGKGQGTRSCSLLAR